MCIIYFLTQTESGLQVPPLYPDISLYLFGHKMYDTVF